MTTIINPQPVYQSVYETAVSATGALTTPVAIILTKTGLTKTITMQVTGNAGANADIVLAAGTVPGIYRPLAGSILVPLVVKTNSGTYTMGSALLSNDGGIDVSAGVGSGTTFTSGNPIGIGFGSNSGASGSYI